MSELPVNETLSQDEVDSLLSGGQPAAGSVSAEPAGASHRVEPFDPNIQRRVVHGRLHTLEMINERFARDFRVSLFNLIRRSADITVESVKTQAYRDFARNVPAPANINVVSMKPLRGSALIVFPPDLVFLVVDSLFGGNGRLLAKPEGRDFTPTEQRVILRLLKLALESYDQSWHSVYPVDFAFERAEMQVRFANITSSPNEAVINTIFHFDAGAFSTRFQICLPYAAIEPIHGVLSEIATQNANAQELHARGVHLADQLQESEVELVARFAELGLTLGKLADLKAGDVLPLNLPQSIQVSVAQIPVFEAGYGRIGQHKALRVMRLLDRASVRTKLGKLQ